MNVFDRSLLSLSSLCLEAGADPALPAGSHLRWNLAPELGFPHGGFRVRSRAAPAWPWPKTDYQVGILMNRNVVATSIAGIHLVPNTLRIEDGVLTPQFGVHCVRRKPVRFVYEQRDQTDPVFEPWVRFAVLLGRDSGSPGGIVRLKGFAMRNGHRVQVAEMSGRLEDLPLEDPRRPDSLKAIFLGHGELDLVTLEAPDDVIVQRVLYTTAGMLDRAQDWDVLTVLGPLCAPGTADVMAPRDVEALARGRLEAARPLRRVTEPGTAGRGRPLSSADHLRFEARLIAPARQWADAMTRAFRLEVDARRPPGTITAGELDTAPRTAGARGGALDIPLYGLMQVASFEPHLAAMLGLAFLDPDGADGAARDYAVDAVISGVWLQYAMASEPARRNLDLGRIPKALITPRDLSGVWDTLPAGFARLASFAVDQSAGKAEPLFPPHIVAELRPDRTRRPVQARVTLAVQAGAPGVRPLLWRAGDAGSNDAGLTDVVLDLMPTDVASEQLIPALPPQPAGVVNADDPQLPGYGTVHYGATNVDAFGRSSSIAGAKVEVRDVIAPPAPGTPEVAPGPPDPDGRSLFPSARVSFVWSDAAAASTPDLNGFEVVWRAGSHAPEDVLRQAEGRHRIDWPLNDDQETEREVAGLRIIETLDLPTVRDGHRQEVTVVCTAHDEAGNVSPPSRPGYGVRIDEIKAPAPPQPPEPQWSSWPDANDEVRWRCRWEVPANVQSSRLLTASEARLLHLSGTERQAHAALAPAERAAALKEIACRTPNAFAPSELALPAPIDHADVVMKAGGNDWRVALVEFIGATGQKSPWPETVEPFAVIRPRTLAPIAPPSLTIHVADGAAVIHVHAGAPGRIEIFEITHPDLVDAATALGPVATLGTDAQDPLVIDLADRTGWLGFAAWLHAEDGRRSELSPVLWRLAATK